MERITLHVTGMMCSACVARVECALAAVPGVSKARVNLASKSAKVTFEEKQVSRADLVRAIEEAGYGVSDEPQPRISPAKIAAVALGAVAIWLIVSILGFDLSGTDFPLATSGMGYGMLFVVGVLTSFHCVAMCGGINISQCMPASADAGAAAGAGAGAAASPSAGTATRDTTAGTEADTATDAATGTEADTATDAGADTAADATTSTKGTAGV